MAATKRVSSLLPFLFSGTIEDDLHGQTAVGSSFFGYCFLHTVKSLPLLVKGEEKGRKPSTKCLG